MSHMPGPWTAYVGGTGDAPDFYVQFSDVKPSIMMPLSLGLEGGWATARLIAAAPDLLGALTKLDALIDFSAEWTECGCFREPDRLNDTMKLAMAAIAKATGEQP